MIRKLRLLFSPLLLIFLAATLWADTPTQSSYYPEQLYWFEDPSNSLSAAKIVADGGLNSFQQLAGHTLQLGYRKGVVWVYIPLGEKLSINGIRYLSIDTNITTAMTLFIPTADGNFQEAAAQSRSIPGHPLIYSSNKLVRLPDQASPAGLILRLQTPQRIQMSLSVWDSRSIQAKEIETLIISNLIIGITLFMMVYSLLVYLSLGSRLYLYYAFFLAALTLLQLTFSGQARFFFWPEAYTWQKISVPFTLILTLASGLEFSRLFLRCNTQAPFINTLFKGILVLLGCSALALFFIPGDYTTAIGIIASVVVNLAISLSCLYLFFRGNRIARFLFLAWFTFFLSGIVDSLNSISFFQSSIIRNNGHLIFTGIAVLFFSLAMGDQLVHWLKQKIRQEKHSRQQLQASNSLLEDTLVKLKKSNRVKDRFLSMLSHELRTPMNGVESALQLITTDNLNSNQSKYLVSAKKSASEMTQLVDSILRFSELQSDQLAVSRETVEIRPLLQQAEQQFRQACQQKGLRFNWCINKSVPSLLKLDPDNVLLICRQLVDNAIKFTDQGSISVDWQVTGDSQLQFVVSDTGCGIPVAEQQRILQPFFQIDRQYNQTKGGLGIGLPMCHQLLQLMQGEMHFSPETEHGTTVTVTLPVSIPQQQQLDEAGLETDNYRDKTILIAEDNPVNRMLLSALVETLGCYVLTAENGHQVIELLQQHPVDLILMDCQMPELDGIEATRQIRASQHHWRDIPILAVTANALSGDSQQCLSAGMNDYLKKPVQREVLHQKVRHWLRSKNPSAA